MEKVASKPSIELYSGKYFAACGLGGIIGTQCPLLTLLSLRSTANQQDVSNKPQPADQHTQQSRPSIS